MKNLFSIFLFILLSLIFKVKAQEDAAKSYITNLEGDDLTILCTVQLDANNNLVGKFSTKNAAGYFTLNGREYMFMANQIYLTSFNLNEFAIKWFQVFSDVSSNYFKQPVGIENGDDVYVCRRIIENKTVLCKLIGNVCYCPYFGQELPFFDSFDILYSANRACDL
ncbi:hypothetical protein PVAND_009316 [Polypedilum vanderplanki]|uniref:Uncharacterized protein n=1 Tax=Polypedilum vanderplanki TaxID=319348 RepID=A0A9J6CCJ3_POLVA|nr:hypothetical protein PVAND_009316 [Polypedilum vanderplanki]